MNIKDLEKEMKKATELVDEFIIPVRRSVIEEVLVDLGFKPSSKNVDLVLEADVLTEACQDIQQELGFIIARTLLNKQMELERSKKNG